MCLKTWPKSNFFLNKEYTRDKINSICLSIDKYNKLKNNIIAEKQRLINEYEQDSEEESQETLNELLKTDLEIKKYTPIEVTYLEELISPDYVKEIIELLDKIKSKLD